MKHDTRLAPVSDKRIKIAVEAAREAGLDVAAIEVSRDGSIRILGPQAFPVSPKDEFEAWDQSGKLG